MPSPAVEVSNVSTLGEEGDWFVLISVPQTTFCVRVSANNTSALLGSNVELLDTELELLLDLLLEEDELILEEELLDLLLDDDLTLEELLGMV